MSTSAGAGAGSSSAAALAPSDAGAVGAPVGRVFIKRSGDVSARFAKVVIYEGDDVFDLAERASRVRGWGADAAYVDLFLVEAAHAEAVENGDESKGVTAKKLFASKKLADVDVLDGSHLLARLGEASVAAPGECAQSCRRPDGSPNGSSLC